MVLDFDFESRLTLHAKRDKIKLTISIVFLEKCDFFANDSKHRQIIYHWKLFFATSLYSGSLPQNKALLGSDQLSKFCHFARKHVPLIRAFSSQMEGTITTRRSKGTD